MIFSITYSDDRMSKSAAVCVGSAAKHGVDFPYMWNESEIEQDFYSDNLNTLKCDRGAGYWIWKPYVINKMMRIVEDGDYLIYADAGVEFVANVNEIISRMDEDIFFFTNGFPHVEWCKGDVLNAINHGLLESIGVREYKQVQASVIFFKVNQKTREFVKEWLLWCQMPGFIDDSPSKTSNYPTFAEHRHDQAILTSLQIKYGYKLHFWPTHYSEHIRYTAQPEDNYPTLFNHHRKRNNEY